MYATEYNKAIETTPRGIARNPLRPRVNTEEDKRKNPKENENNVVGLQIDSFLGGGGL